jgi:hypothetical protein
MPGSNELAQTHLEENLSCSTCGAEESSKPHSFPNVSQKSSTNDHDLPKFMGPLVFMYNKVFFIHQLIQLLSHSHLSLLEILLI